MITRKEDKIWKNTGLKKAVGDYQKFNKGGRYDPHYGLLMFDKSTGELWTDEFYDLGHNSYIEYNSADIVDLVLEMRYYYLREFGKYEPEITMKTVKDFILKNYEGFEF